MIILLIEWLLFPIVWESDFSSSKHENRYRVAVIDQFYPGDSHFIHMNSWEKQTELHLNGVVDVDRDRVREPYYHGDVVSLFLAHPRLLALPYSVEKGQPAKAEILRNLRLIKEQIHQGQAIDGVVLAWESSTLISALEKPLRLENAQLYKSTIRRWGKTSDTWRLSHEIILALEDLTTMGVRVYTIAGNSGSGMVNTYSFANGVITVGATEPDLDRFVSNNVFVDTHAPAAYMSQSVLDATGKLLGYDINNDQCLDIPLERISSYSPEKTQYPSTSWRSIRGSSFAAPSALNAWMHQQFPMPSCVPDMTQYPIVQSAHIEIDTTPGKY